MFHVTALSIDQVRLLRRYMIMGHSWDDSQEKLKYSDRRSCLVATVSTTNPNINLFGTEPGFLPLEAGG